MELSIEQVARERLEDGHLRAVYELQREIALEAAPEDGFFDYESYALPVRREPRDWISTYSLARSGGRVVGSARTGWREVPENRHLAAVHLLVTAPARRQGVGRRLLADAAGIAEAAGRSLLMGDTTGRLPFAGEFCRAVGAELGMVEHENRLELSRVDRELVRSWLEPRPGYDLLLVEGAIPAELHLEFARVLDVMNDAPRGTLRADDEHEKPGQTAAFEAMVVGGGSHLRTVLARHAGSGGLAGFTRVSWHPSMPSVVWQWGTAVERDHRGHGLGRWMKATMLDRILRERPDARRIATTNATTNRWMLAINQELGFEPVSTQLHWQVEAAAVRYTSRQPARLLE